MNKLDDFPSIPDVPLVPSVPLVPEVPSIPLVPEVPSVPLVPDVPDDPENCSVIEEKYIELVIPLGLTS